MFADDHPAKAVDDADHGVERIEQAPFVGTNVTAETHRRNIQPHLHDKRDNIAKIAVFDIERGNPITQSERGQSSLQQKQGQHGGKDHDRIRRLAFGRQFSEFAEHERKNNHGQQRAYNRPSGADNGLFVANLKVPPSQKIE